MTDITNETLAERFRLTARDLEKTHSQNLYRIRAYRRAAQTILFHPLPICELFERGGEEAILRLPGIGESLGREIVDYILAG